MSKQKRCPKCDVVFTGTDVLAPAISRRDNETEICSNCGTAEALSDFILTKGV
tara:strand:- start:19 stop:177 length:159 start_codon:yes stop_codon:yes gene_type:complete